MPRGGPVKRTRTVSTRLTSAEWQAWDQRRAQSGRRELGAWVRAVVHDAEGLRVDGRQAGEVPVVPELNRDAYRQLVGAAQNLNQIARRVNLTGEAGAELKAALDEVRAAARAVRGA